MNLYHIWVIFVPHQGVNVGKVGQWKDDRLGPDSFDAPGPDESERVVRRLSFRPDRLQTSGPEEQIVLLAEMHLLGEFDRLTVADDLVRRRIEHGD